MLEFFFKVKDELLCFVLFVIEKEYRVGTFFWVLEVVCFVFVNAVMSYFGGDIEYVSFELSLE